MKNTLEHYPIKYLEMIYKAARNCYGVRDAHDSEEKMARLAKYLIEHGHESVLEHICVSIYSTGVSRSFLAQLTRHRLVSYSVKSQHYTKHNDFEYKELEDWGKRQKGQTRLVYLWLMGEINRVYKGMVDRGIPHYIAREILPNSCLTDMYITTNVREWRYIIGLRITKNNTPEIKAWARQVLLLLWNNMPELFEDLMAKYTTKSEIWWSRYNVDSRVWRE